MYGHYLANFMSLVILQYMISNILMIMQIDDMSDGYTLWKLLKYWIASPVEWSGIEQFRLLTKHDAEEEIYRIQSYSIMTQE